MNEITKNAGHANESFRFVQLSDLHLSHIGIPNPLRLMNKRILGYLSWLKKRRHTHQRWVLDCALANIRRLGVEHYVMTGDFTHIGLKHEFNQVASWLSKIGDSKDVTIIPGNHDLYVSERWDRSFALWENYMAGDNQPFNNTSYSEDALQRLNSYYPIIRKRRHVAFIALSSIFDAPWFRATGYIASEQLHRLESILKSRELDNFCKILLIHHPITLTNTPARKSLLNHSMLSEILQEYPVQLVLHGHGHSTNLESLICSNNSETPVIGISSSSSISQIEEHKAEFMLFDIQKTHSHWDIQSQNHTLDVNKQLFIQTRTKKYTATL